MPLQKVTAEDEELAPKRGSTSKLRKVIKKKSNATSAVCLQHKATQCIQTAQITAELIHECEEKQCNANVNHPASTQASIIASL